MTIDQILMSIQLAESLLTAVQAEMATTKATWAASDLATVQANLDASLGRLAAAKAQADEDAVG